MEEAHCTLMRLFAEMGQPSAVLKQYQELEKVLQEAFGEAPSAATRQLMETLRERAQANLPHTVNGNYGKLSQTPLQANGETPPSARLKTSPERLEPSTKSLSRPMPAGRASAAARRRLLLGAISIVAILVALGSVLLHRKAVLTKSGLLVPNAKRIWVQHCYPVSDEKPTNQPTAITTDAAGNIYITGYVFTLHNDVDFLTLKYDPNGKLLWRAPRYNGPGNDVDRARSIAVDKDGNVYVTGESDNGKGNGLTRLAGVDWATIKYDKDGHPSPTWPDVGFGVGVRRYNGPDDGEDRPYKVCVDGQGNVYVAGYSDARRQHNGKTIPVHEWVLVKYDPMGHQIYARREHPSVEWLAAAAQDMVVDPAGNIYVAGYWDIAYQGLAKAAATVIKYAPDGEHIWRKTYPGKGVGSTSLSYIILDGAGYVYVAGEQYDGAQENNGTLNDWVTIKYDAGGNRIWEPRVFDNNHQEDISKSLAVDASGDVCIAGISGPIGDSRYLSVRYDPNGNLNWARTYSGTASSGTANLSNCAFSAAFDPAGNVIVTGQATDAITNQHPMIEPQLILRKDNVTIKYDPAGHILWKGVYDEGAFWTDEACQVTLDKQNNVIVAGQSDVGNDTRLTTIIKYAPDAGP